MRHLLVKCLTGMIVGLGGLVTASSVSAFEHPWLNRLQHARNLNSAESDTGQVLGDYSMTITVQGEQRHYLLHIPRQYVPKHPLPLLVSLHGGGGNMHFQADDDTYGQIQASERWGFIVAFPNGFSRLNSGKFATWNAGACCGVARDQKSDDVAFIRALVADVSAHYAIDRSRIFADGMSNGGMMSYRLACEAADLFRGIAAVAGTDNTLVCSPARPVAILHIHARDDDHVLYQGGVGPALAREGDAVTPFTSVPATVAKWQALNHCTAQAATVVDVSGAQCVRYSHCAGESQVQLCTTETGGHSWPGGHARRGKEPASQAISANMVMWDFFSQLK